MAKQIITIDLGPWELCDDPNCNHKSHGSLRRVLDILFTVRERVRRQDPEKFARLEAEMQARLQERIRQVGQEQWDRMVAEAEARRQVREALANAAAGRAG